MEVLQKFQSRYETDTRASAKLVMEYANLSRTDHENTSNVSLLERNSRQLGGGDHVVWTNDVVFRVSAISALICLTLLGNVSLLLLMSCYRRLRKRRVNIFLMNLAVADLMVCAVTMTTEIVFVAFGEWVLGNVGCKLVVYGQIVTLAGTTFLLTAMSIDRYQVRVIVPYCDVSADGLEHRPLPGESDLTVL